MRADNPFNCAYTIKELIGQVIGAGSACWINQYCDDGEGEMERVFDSERASFFVSYAVGRLRQLITAQGGKWPDESSAHESSPPGIYQGKSIHQRIQEALEEAKANVTKEAEIVAINPECDELQLAYLEGTRDGIETVLAIFSGGSEANGNI